MEGLPIVLGGKKEGGGSSSVQCPMLNSTNYTVWAMRMKVCLKISKVWDVVENESTDGDKNNLAMGLLFQSIPESLILQVGELDTAKKIWEAIKTRHLGAERVKEARLQTLMADFDRLKMKDEDSIDSFVGKLSEIASKSATLGAIIEESKLVKKFLKCLPRKKYIHIVASLEQILDLNTTSFEDIIGRLKAYEERIFDEEEEQSHEEQTKLMYSEKPSRGNDNTSRGRGRGGRSKGRGQGRNSNERDLSKVVCYRCDKLGHYASKCPDRLLKLQETQEESNDEETQEADDLLMHEIVYLNEEKCIPSKFETNHEDNTWYLDNGASNHMTGDRRFFTKIDEKVTGKVRFGDDSRIDIKGKGTISFIDRNGEAKKMTNVYYIPGLKSNIISLGQATESGCDIRMNGDNLTMLDQEGKLIVKAKRSQNRLYKVRMEVMEPRVLLTEDDESSKWHARLGHINIETIKAMINKELVKGIPRMKIEKKICGSCLLGKQTRQKFPQETTYRAESILELIHGDLCGPITPKTAAGNRYVFVLIDDHSRYMWTILLKEKGEAAEKFTKFKDNIEKERKERIRVFRTDRGGEFLSKEFVDFCKNNGIKRQLTAPYTPQQNGVVERRNRTLMEMTRSIMKHMRLPTYLWGEAIRHSTYLLNRIASRAIKERTPYEIFHGRKPNVNHLRTFGCICYAKIEAQHLKKLDDRSRILVHLGTEPGSKAYRLLDPTTRKIFVSRDVIFDETKSWIWDLETQESQGNLDVVIEEMSLQYKKNFENKDDTQEKQGSETIKHTKSATLKEEGARSRKEVEGEKDEDVQLEQEEEDVTSSVELRRSQRESTKPTSSLRGRMLG